MDTIKKSKKQLTDINGVYAAGMHCGIKPKKKDLGYIYVPNAVASAAVFTVNQFVAPCLTYTKKVMKTQISKAVIVNSGNANAGTGDQGLKDAKATAQKAASLLKLNTGEVAVCSTGVIGKLLPLQTITEGLDILLAKPKTQDAESFSEAILTTDTCTKAACYEAKIGKKTITVAGITKGSGMIAPNMATMLGYLVTDATLPQALLQEVLLEAVKTSFNMITVDGDTSTNDMVMMFATGEKKFTLTNRQELEIFQKLVSKVCEDLAKLIAKDGEGAKTMIEVQIVGAARYEDARKMALNIVNSPLVKTAIHGADPNWGRVLAAAGKDPSLKFNMNKLDLYFGGFKTFQAGEILNNDYDAMVEALKKDEVVIKLDLNLGKAHATAWGCDLTKGYININTKYT